MKLPPLPTCNYGRDTFPAVGWMRSIRSRVECAPAAEMRDRKTCHPCSPLFSDPSAALGQVWYGIRCTTRTFKKETPIKR